MYSPSHSESPGQRKQRLYQHLILLVTSGDKCAVISSEKEFFEEENVMLRDSTELIFHFDCLKDAIKKQSNLLVQRGGGKAEVIL